MLRQCGHRQLTTVLRLDGGLALVLPHAAEIVSGMHREKFAQKTFEFFALPCVVDGRGVCRRPVEIGTDLLPLSPRLSQCLSGVRKVLSRGHTTS